MPWLAVDKFTGDKKGEYIFDSIPIRGSCFWNPPDYIDAGSVIELPKGTIKHLIGRDLTWEDEPVEFTEVVG